MADNAGFSGVKVFSDGKTNTSIFAFAMPYGNEYDNKPPENYNYGIIAPFARFNYYKEAVIRLKKIASCLRSNYGGKKSDYRIFCNSKINEKHIAAVCGLGCFGRNNLIITENSGSLVVLSFLKVPFEIEGDIPDHPAHFKFCEICADNPACAKVCPTGAISKDGIINRANCIQWYASGNEKEVPENIKKNWGKCFYGCNICQDICPHNNKTIKGIKANIGQVESFLDIKKFLLLSDNEIKSKFRGTALGMKWLTPEILRRNAYLCLS